MCKPTGHNSQAPLPTKVVGHGAARSRLHCHCDFVRKWAREMSSDMLWLRRMAHERGMQEPTHPKLAPLRRDGGSTIVSAAEFDELESQLSELKAQVLQLRAACSKASPASSTPPRDVRSAGASLEFRVCQGRTREDTTEACRATPPRTFSVPSTAMLCSSSPQGSRSPFLVRAMSKPGSPTGSPCMPVLRCRSPISPLRMPVVAPPLAPRPQPPVMPGWSMDLQRQQQRSVRPRSAQLQGHEVPRCNGFLRLR
mmetsp:Transcript_70968/g.164070  ORF Transcript_70968/g.164070 Transcript_70968/m.164070 type:complete len:254 (+) Transcript_70968:76-837(+)